MSTKLMVAFIVVCVYGGLITFGYIEERHKNKKKSRPRDWHQERGKIKYPNHILNQNRRFVKWTIKS